MSHYNHNTLRQCIGCIEPHDTPVRIPDGRVLTVADTLALEVIPGDCGGAIYSLYMHQGLLSVGIAQPPAPFGDTVASIAASEAWIAEQVAHPLVAQVRPQT